MKAAARSRRDRIRAQLADLKMPGALEAIDDVLTGVDGGGVTASEAIEQLLGAQITLRNNRRLQAAMRSSRLPGIKTLDDFDAISRSASPLPRLRAGAESTTALWPTSSPRSKKPRPPASWDAASRSSPILRSWSSTRSATCRSARPAPCSSSNSSTGAMSAHPLC